MTRPLRDGDTLGRAGRSGPNGGPIETSRVRVMSSEDKRRVTVDGRAVPGVVIDQDTIVYTPDPVSADVKDEHRGLQYLDGKSEPRPPAAWENANAQLRSDKARAERETFSRLRRHRRDSMTLAQLADHVSRRLLTLAQPRAKQTRQTDARNAVVGDRSPQGEGHGAVGSADETGIDLKLRLARLLIEEVDDEIARHDGLPVKLIADMTGEEKDSLITGKRFRGLDPKLVGALFPELGSAKTVRYVRSMAGQDGLGERRETKEAA